MVSNLIYIYYSLNLNMKVFAGQLLSLSYQSSMASYHINTQSSS